jgi:hypothetical protein
MAATGWWGSGRRTTAGLRCVLRLILLGRADQHSQGAQARACRGLQHPAPPSSLPGVPVAVGSAQQCGASGSEGASQQAQRCGAGSARAPNLAMPLNQRSSQLQLQAMNTHAPHAPVQRQRRARCHACYSHPHNPAEQRRPSCAHPSTVGQHHEALRRRCREQCALPRDAGHPAPQGHCRRAHTAPHLPAATAGASALLHCQAGGCAARATTRPTTLGAGHGVLLRAWGVVLQNCERWAHALRCCLLLMRTRGAQSMHPRVWNTLRCDVCCGSWGSSVRVVCVRVGPARPAATSQPLGVSRRC